MSAEVEVSPAEGVKEERKPIIKLKKSLRSYIEIGLIVANIAQLFLCVLILSLIYEPISIAHLANISLHHVGIIYVSTTGYMLINGVILLSRVIGEKMPYRTSSLFALMGSALFLVAGILLVIDIPIMKRELNFPPRGHLYVMLIASIIFIFANAILFTTDAVFCLVMYMS